MPPLILMVYLDSVGDGHEGTCESPELSELLFYLFLADDYVFYLQNCLGMK